MAKKRAITLAGGGPAAGLHIGALKALEEAKITFDVWALSCIGAWVGVVYNTRIGRDKADQTHTFFRDKVFRDDATYEWFPVNRAFAANMDGFGEAWLRFIMQRWWRFGSLVDWPRILDAMRDTVAFMSEPQRWSSRAERNAWLLNDVLAVHPMSRLWTGLMFLSEINGLANIYYKDSPFLESIHIDRLAQLPVDIYHNAWNVGAEQIQLFHNHPHKFPHRKYLPIDARSLCACSALPYVEQSVDIDGVEYCEGALVDTVNFKDLLQEYSTLDEIWINRIVDYTQVRAPKNLHDGLANLCMLFAAEVGENDVKLFRHHLRKSTTPRPRVVEIPIIPRTKVGFEWNVSNLDRGVEEGHRATIALLERNADLRV